MYTSISSLKVCQAEIYITKMVVIRGIFSTLSTIMYIVLQYVVGFNCRGTFSYAAHSERSGMDFNLRKKKITAFFV